MSRIPFVSLVTLALCLCTGLANADEPAVEALTRVVNGRTFDQFVQKALVDYAVPGAVIAVAKSDGPVFVRGYGVREVGKTALVDTQTRFQIASVSKFIAATAVGTLVDRGIVAWDRPIATFAPQLELAVPYATQNATLRDFFAHRTGLPAYTGDLLTEFELEPAELVRRARFLPFDHSFRERWAYSNYGVFLGQQAAAQAAGLTAPQLLAHTVLEPLGMKRSGPVQAILFEDENRAAAHDLDGSVMAYENVDAFSGAGAVVSTGADIARWMSMLLAGGVFEGRQMLTDATLGAIVAASMVEGPSGPLHDPNAAAGLGCDSYHFLNRRVVEKNGALNGVRTIVSLIPELKVGIAIFANKQLTVFPEAVRAEFLEREIGASGRDLQAEIRSEQASWTNLVAIPKPPADALPMAHPLDAYAGVYQGALYGQLRIAATNDGLVVTIGGRPAKLTLWSGDAFLLTFPNPDVAPGLLTFRFQNGAATSARIDGSRVAGTMSVNYGSFTRVP
ncbi:CubicO group peptidase (beta-lactamase class C family) [Methylobacterium sp. BE186]|uniref:serine hydrolase n=1 Tax=Methylobacterium sp. BE186 TaxID=2817715 RepID=UPI0028545224|nr:serine hydrolase [Methylobacterium sp. BE186]MDR7040657.1 CubicO group peptidase (beta-lactamase class C family) [Methylobacterium sp. BE186]